MLTKSEKPEKDDCTYDEFIKYEKSSKYLVPYADCNECIFDVRFITEANKKLHELIPIILLEIEPDE